MTPGSRLILGLQKSHLTNSIKDFLRQKQIGGVILFDHNAENIGELKSLVAEINAACSPGRPFIGIDFEGGRVRRLGKLFGPLRRAEDYADNLTGLSEDCARLAKQFSACGINFNFAPVCDLTYAPLNVALADRTFSTDPALTAAYCLEFHRAFSGAGIMTCFKHFPGLGSAVNDPHASMAISCIPFERLRDFDLVPYKAGIRLGIKIIMTSHILISSVDGEIATFSKRTTDLARSLGFAGVLITDDLSMGALKDILPLRERVLKALCAGHDMALVCHDHDDHLVIVEYLEKNLNTLMRSGHLKALSRIEHAKKQLAA